MVSEVAVVFGTLEVDEENIDIDKIVENWWQFNDLIEKCSGLLDDIRMTTLKWAFTLNRSAMRSKISINFSSLLAMGSKILISIDWLLYVT